MTKTSNSEDERFRAGAKKYASYLETREGRLRLDLTFSNLEEYLPVENRERLCALDVGCGTAAMAMRLARLGIRVTALDSSADMLHIAESAPRDRALREKLVLRKGNAEELGSCFGAGSFDVITCHNVLEYVTEPANVLTAVARLLRDGAGVVSVLVRNQAGEVLKAALGAGDLAQAEKNLNAGWGQESLYGGRARLFTPAALEEMLNRASLAVLVMRGVRVIADYLPPATLSRIRYRELLQLERKLGAQPQFAAVARYTHCLARRTGSGESAV